MLLVETFINCTAGKGVGLFAKKPIAKGTVYWIRNESFDRVFTLEHKNSLEPIAAEYLEKYGFMEANGNWYLCNDNARFSNHSNKPNSYNHFDDHGIVKYCTTSKDILEGEEILCDYTEVCQTCKEGVNFVPLN